jgi:alkylation response protein AidB-like acyl-CoA dehydrogenase
MNLELTAEQLALRDSVRRFLAEQAPVAGHVRAMLDDPAGSTDAVWRGLADLGVTGLLVPAEHGGAGTTMVEAGIVLEELGRALHPGPWPSTAVAATRALTRLGSGDATGDAAGEAAGDAAGKLLTGIADGSTIATIGLRDAMAPTAAAVRRGDGVVLTGEVAEVPDAGAASVLLVLATGGDRVALFAVDTVSPGCRVTPQPTIDGTRKQSRVTLDGAPARRLGDAPADAVQAVVDDVLVAWAADALGAAQAVFELAVGYAKTRTQFGQPIGAFQAVQHLCADMYETVELARSGVIHALWAADAASDEERHLAAIRVKAFAGRLAGVGESAIQVFGGIGYTWEHDAHLYLKRLLSWSAFLGGPDRYLREIGSQLARTVYTPRSTP